MFTEKIKATGNLIIEHFDSAGNKIDTRNINNLVVTAGKDYVISRMKNNIDVMSHMGLGTNNTAAVVENTDLGTQLSNRQPLTSATNVANTITYVGTFGPGVCTGAITEAGIFNALTSGIMLARTVFGVVNKSAADTIIITWTITIS